MHHAWSPKAGINLRYAGGDRNPGSLYLSVSRSFKAPTLDQLYDQRSIPVPFPPFAIQTSNPGLRPQHGTSYEGGLYQSAALSSSVRADLAASAYQMDMTDELDFDVASLHYVNLGRSRHRGIDAGGSLGFPHGSAFVSYAWQHPASRSGSNAGKRLKAIPLHSLTAGAAWRTLGELSTGLSLTHAAGVFLDDANTRKLPAYTRVDGQLELALRGARVLLEGRNLFNARYSSTGFLDPAGSGAAYFYPAAGRVLELGLRYGW
jgi:outer membrane receptor protein involved in Fe transport